MEYFGTDLMILLRLGLVVTRTVRNMVLFEASTKLLQKRREAERYWERPVTYLF
jgi:hypothetical protein